MYVHIGTQNYILYPTRTSAVAGSVNLLFLAISRVYVRRTRYKLNYYRPPVGSHFVTAMNSTPHAGTAVLAADCIPSSKSQSPPR